MESSPLEGLNFPHAPTPTPLIPAVSSEPTLLRSERHMNQLEELATVSRSQTQLASNSRNYEYETGLSSSPYAGTSLDSRSMPRENPWYSQPTFYSPQIAISSSGGDMQTYYTPSIQYHLSHPSPPSYIIPPPSLEYFRPHMQSRPFEQQYVQMPYDESFASQSYILHPHPPQSVFNNQIAFQNGHSSNPTSFGQPHIPTVQLLPVHATQGHAYYPRLNVPSSGGIHAVPMQVMAVQPPSYKLVVDYPKKQPARFQQKPKDLENAIWVGNLPNNTNPDELRAFFESNEALPPNGLAEFEGVFHIAKTHCAFVNYKSSSAVLRNIAAFHDREFKGVRLVCRAKKSSTPHVAPAEAFSDANRSSGNTSELSRSISSSSKATAGTTSPLRPKPSKSSRQQRGEDPIDARYFILKSLTQDDLDISVKSGVWATQPHNESALNRAFKSADSVYLIFSANKSGEFYGYARMTSLIVPSHSETSIEWTPVEDGDENDDSETTKAPKDLDQANSIADVNSADEAKKREKQKEKQWGNNFSVEWIKVRKLSFMQTRHIRNPWNSNREAKVSRDGTELETRTGERLLQEFHNLDLEKDPSSSSHWLAQEEPHQQPQQGGSVESDEPDYLTVKNLNPQEGSVQFRGGDSLSQQNIPIIVQPEDLEQETLQQQPQLQASALKEIDGATEQPSPQANLLALSGEKMAITSASPLPIDDLDNHSQYNPNISNLINDRRTESSPTPRSPEDQETNCVDRRRTV